MAALGCASSTWEIPIGAPAASLKQSGAGILPALSVGLLPSLCPQLFETCLQTRNEAASVQVYFSGSCARRAVRGKRGRRAMGHCEETESALLPPGRQQCHQVCSEHGCLLFHGGCVLRCVLCRGTALSCFVASQKIQSFEAFMAVLSPTSSTCWDPAGGCTAPGHPAPAWGAAARTHRALSCGAGCRLCAGLWQQVVLSVRLPAAGGLRGLLSSPPPPRGWQTPCKPRPLRLS